MSSSAVASTAHSARAVDALVSLPGACVLRRAEKFCFCSYSAGTTASTPPSEVKAYPAPRTSSLRFFGTVNLQYARETSPFRTVQPPSPSGGSSHWVDANTKPSSERRSSTVTGIGFELTLTITHCWKPKLERRMGGVNSDVTGLSSSANILPPSANPQMATM